MINNRIIVLCILLIPFLSNAQIARVYQLNSGWNSPLPRTNAINDIIVRHDTVWFGTERGLSFTADGGTSWTNFSSTNTFDNKGISGLAIRNDVIWVATGYSTKLGEESVQTGGGLHYSTDRGVSWKFIPQPVDQLSDTIEFYGNNRIRAMAVTVPQNNITFDITLTSSTVWIASWAGMLRKRPINLDTAWTRVILPPDNLSSIKPTDLLNYFFDLSPSAGRLGLQENNNHKLFSVYASDDTTIWAGTADGINKSTDGGLSWLKFNHQNQTNSISGNWVLAIKEQIWRDKKIIWAGTKDTKEDEIAGLSFSDNGGESWRTALHGEWVHNIAVKDSVVYIAADGGLFRSNDFGNSWIQSGSIYDPTNLQRFVSSELYGVGAQGDTVWVGGPEGTAYTIDSPSNPFGSTWRIFRTAEQVKDEARTYSFPNPFTPDNEPVRLHYSLGTNSGTQIITIRIFDYAMQPVRTLIQGASRLNGREYDEIWDGRNDNRSFVANGVYFYRVEIGDQVPIWGKILVIR